MFVSRSDVNQFIDALSFLMNTKVKRKTRRDSVPEGDDDGEGKDALEIDVDRLSNIEGQYAYQCACGMIVSEAAHFKLQTKEIFSRVPEALVNIYAPKHSFDVRFAAEAVVNACLSIADEQRIEKLFPHFKEQLIMADALAVAASFQNYAKMPPMYRALLGMFTNGRLLESPGTDLVKPQPIIKSNALKIAKCTMDAGMTGYKLYTEMCQAASHLKNERLGVFRRIHRTKKRNARIVEIMGEVFKAILPLVNEEDESYASSSANDLISEMQEKGMSSARGGKLPTPDGTKGDIDKGKQNKSPGGIEPGKFKGKVCENIFDMNVYENAMGDFKKLVDVLMETKDSMKITTNRPIGAKINRRKLHRCMIDGSLFSIRNSTEGEDLNIAICVDSSGSMEGIFSTAMAVSKAIGDTLYYAGANVRVWTFDAYTNEVQLDEMAQSRALGGSTYGKKAASNAMSWLKTARNGRRICAFITDGMLGDRMQTAQIVREGIMDGIETILIGVRIRLKDVPRTWGLEDYEVSVASGNTPSELVDDITNNIGRALV